MTVTPIQAAKVVNARRHIGEVLTGHCSYPDEVARLVIDEIRNLGWTPPGWRDDDAVPQPSTSTPQARRAALEAAAEAVRAAKERRKKPMEESN